MHIDMSCEDEVAYSIFVEVRSAQHAHHVGTLLGNVASQGLGATS